MENSTQKNSKSTIKTIVGIIVVLFLAWLIFGGGDAKLVQPEMDAISNQVATDAVQQYEIAARRGDKMQMYVQAGMVTAAFLQAKDEANYNKWKNTEDSLALVLKMEIPK